MNEKINQDSLFFALKVIGIGLIITFVVAVISTLVILSSSTLPFFTLFIALLISASLSLFSGSSLFLLLSASPRLRSTIPIKMRLLMSMMLIVVVTNVVSAYLEPASIAASITGYSNPCSEQATLTLQGTCKEGS